MQTFIAVDPSDQFKSITLTSWQQNLKKSNKLFFFQEQLLKDLKKTAVT